MALDTFSWLKVALSLTAKVVLPNSYNPGSTDAQRQVPVGEEWAFSETLRADNSPDPAPAAVVVKEITIAAGEATIDLTAAPILGAESGGVPAATEDLTGKNLIAWFLSAEQTTPNTSAITVKAHATNGYDLFGASGLVVLPPGAIVAGRCETGGRDPVAAADAVIHFTGGTDGDKLRVILVFEA